MRFSFLMCVHADQPFLDKSIKSMIKQDYDGEYEIIIVANNCDNDLWKKLEVYAQRCKKVKLHRTSIGQLAFNLNFGFDLANGEYVVRMDADDVCLSSRLCATERMLHTHNFPDVLSGLAELIDDNDIVIGKPASALSRNKVSRLLRFKNPIVHPASAIKRESLLKVRGYLGGINCEDRDLWLRMDRIGMSIVVADFIAIQYRINPYQVKGSRIAYADGVGLLLREALFRGSPIFFWGAFVSFCKFYVFSLLGRMK